MRFVPAFFLLIPILWAVCPLRATAEVAPAGDAPQPMSPEERAINSPHWGLDNWIYVAAGGKVAEVTGPHLDHVVSLGRTDFRFRPDGTRIEPATGVNSTFGHALSDFGDRFLITTSGPAMYAIPIPYRYVIRNRYVPGPEENVGAADYHRVYPTSQPLPWRLARGQDIEWVKFYGQREATPNGFFTSACGPLIYRAALLPKQYHGNYFCCDPSQNMVHRCRLQRDGAGFRAERAPTEQQSEFLTSTDPWFRPMNLSVGPDGAIYIVDIYREIIEDYTAIPRFLQQQCNLTAGADRGRIWRLAPKGAPQAKRGKLADLPSDELTVYLEHDNAWWREHAQRILIERQDLEAVAGLAKLVPSGRTPQASLHALFTLAGLSQLKSKHVRQALGPEIPAGNVAFNEPSTLADPAGVFRIDTVAGDGTSRLVGQPFGVELGPDGALYICEVENHRVRRRDPHTGVLTTVAGTGTPGYRGDGGPADRAELNEPYEIRVDAIGNLFFVEMKNHIVRRVDAETGTITTVAGNGVEGYAGDGGSATAAQLSVPHSIALDDQGQLYIADIGNHRIRCVDLAAGTIDTIAGNGQEILPLDGQLGANKPILGPRALFIRNRTMWIALREGHSIWTMDLDTGKLSHVAGTGERGYSGDGGPALDATFSGPKGIALGPDGDVYVVDTENQAVRHIDGVHGQITTLTGRGPDFCGYGGDGGRADEAMLDRPHGICVAADGAVYVGDTNNHRVRRVQLVKEASAQRTTTSADVVAIDWTQFNHAADANKRLAQSTSLLLNCARYNLAWIDRTFDLDQQGEAYVLTGFEEHGVRPACSVIYGLGAVLKSGVYNARIVGMSEAEAKQRTIRLLRGIVRAHRANRGQGEAWGVKYPAPESHEYWQTALWSALSGMGGWLMWEDLDPEAQNMLVAMLGQETKRFFQPDYQVPYWNGEGGDTKAEENSWNSMPLALLAAMMPEHLHVERWKARCSELMISSYSTRDDWKNNETMIDGRPVKKWLAGYNADPGGVVINHGFIHPDYMVAISMNFWGVTSQSLARKRAPQAWDFNAPLIYNTLVSKNWDSPPYEQPGGPIYIPGKANVYYPRGNDWSYHDLTLFYLMDVFANLYFWNNDAAKWMDIRATAMLEMQARHDDRRMFADGEYDSYPGCEQWAFWCLTDSFLPLWLDAHRALSKKANWLAKLAPPVQDSYEHVSH